LASPSQPFQSLQMALDEEIAGTQKYYIPGFGSLASLLASDVDHSLQVYRRFEKLAARDLLYYQSELLELEAVQDEYDRADAVDGAVPSISDLPSKIRRNVRDWSSFKEAVKTEHAAAATSSHATANKSSNSVSTATPVPTSPPPAPANLTTSSTTSIAANSSTDRWKERMDLAMKIRYTLKDYGSCFFRSHTYD